MDADELYRLAPEDFTAARDAAAKERRRAGDRTGAAALSALRRPSVAAWLVNRMAQDSPDLLASLLDLGPALAEAQGGGDATALRALGAQRRELVDAVTRTAVAASGRTVTAAVREEVAGTLDAALADPRSAAAVRSGRLVRALSYAGLGTVDLSGAVAAGAPPAPAPHAAEPGGGKRPDADGRRAEQSHRESVAAADSAAQRAAGRLDDAVRACERAAQRRLRAEQSEQRCAAQVERAAEELERLRGEHGAARDDARQAEQAFEQARRALLEAQKAAESTRRTLDELRRPR